MNKSEYEQLDALLRILFREGAQAWHNVYTKANIAKAKADWLYQTLKADGYVKVRHKGADLKIPDPHCVDLTDSGRSWFSHSNYVKEYVEEPATQYPEQTINIHDSNASGFNARSGVGNQANPSNDGKSFWSNGWTITIGGGIVLMIIALILKYCFGVF